MQGTVMQGIGLNRRNMLGAVAAAAFAGAAPALARGKAGSHAGSHTAVQALIDRYVASGKVPGAVVAIVRPGGFRPEYLMAGKIAFETGTAVSPDTLWRIYSMTKPITAMAVMQQVALGRLTLDTPISAIMPEFKTMRVLIDPAKGLESRPAEKPILVRHLLTHTAGLTYTIVGNDPIEREYRRLGLMPGSATAGVQPGDGKVPNLQGFVAGLASLPLRSEPGTAWRYSVGMDLAGGMLERLTGKSLDRVLSDQLFAPLGMATTGFEVSERRLGKLSSNYAWVTPDLKPIDKPVFIDGPKHTTWLGKQTLLAGGAGLLSSASDYARFGQMLLNEGMFDGRLVMPRGITRLAMSNLLPPGVFYDGVQGYGAGGRVALFDTRASAPDGTAVASYGWGGAAGTLFQVDPVRQMAVVVMLQYLPQQRFPLGKELQLALNQDMV